MLPKLPEISPIEYDPFIVDQPGDEAEQIGVVVVIRVQQVEHLGGVAPGVGLDFVASANRDCRELKMRSINFAEFKFLFVFLQSRWG